MHNYYNSAAKIATYALLALAPFTMLSGCSNNFRQNVTGGGQDMVTIHMPFAYGYSSKCVQGVAGSYSHTYNSTYYDVDFDTPNDRNDPVYAPYDGIVYVHDKHIDSGFGLHTNLELSDGSYIVMGHLSSVLVSNGEYLSSGDIIGYEGTTGNSTGDHVHIGRHSGSASKDASYGTSIGGLSFYVQDSNGSKIVIPVEDMNCDISSGSFYTSVLDSELPPDNNNWEEDEDDSSEYPYPDDSDIPKTEDEDHRISICLENIDHHVEALRLYSITESETDSGDCFYDNGHELFEEYGVDNNDEYCEVIRAYDNEIVALNGFAYIGDYLGQNPSSYDGSSDWRHFVQSTNSSSAYGSAYIDMYVNIDSDGDGNSLNDHDRRCYVDRFEYADYNNGQATDFNSVQAAIVCP